MNLKNIREYVAIPKKERQISWILLICLNLLSLYFFLKQPPNITEVKIEEQVLVDNDPSASKKELLNPRYNKRKRASNKSFYKNNKNEYVPSNFEKDSIGQLNPKYEKKEITILLDSCKREDLIQLKGIGDVLSTRIIKYRNLLGGFVSIDQIQEVYGLKPEVFHEIKNQFKLKGLVKKINLNKANFKSLIRHPYLNKTEVKAILNYRKVHGAFNSVEELRGLYSISDSIFVKIEPYLKTE